jgi:hypothetical protein
MVLLGTAFFETVVEPGDNKSGRNQNRILTIDKGRVTVRRARLALAMISTPGHRASRRRQRGALPAWSYSGRCPAMTSAVVDMRDTAAIERDLACLPGPRVEAA